MPPAEQSLRNSRSTPTVSTAWDARLRAPEREEPLACLEFDRVLHDRNRSGTEIDFVSTPSVVAPSSQSTATPDGNGLAVLRGEVVP